MQSVSTAYKESMKSPLRNRGYIQVSFGIFDEAAQADARIVNQSSATYIYYSDASEVFRGQPSDFVYATLENHFFKVDGSQHLLPSRTSPQQYRNTGLISNSLVTNGNVSFQISLSEPRTWYGMTFDFGENFPTAFDILYGNETLQVRNNTESVYTADIPFEDVDTVILLFRSMKESGTRARLYSVKFGIGYSFGNDGIMDSSLNRGISPISANLPQFDLTVTLKNLDHYFDVDNPDSAINFLSPDIDVTVQYGYELDSGRVEWVPGQTLKCSEWMSDNMTATLVCHDFLRNLNSEYYGGVYDPDGKTYAELAEEVLASAGITEYYLDPVLSEKSTKLPVPKMSHKEALQLIANACCCIMTFDREGHLRIQTVDYNIPLGEFRMEKRDMTSYPEAARQETVKDIIVQYQNWFKNQSEHEILSEETEVSVGEEKTYFFGEPIYDYKVLIEGTDLSSTVIKDSGDYYLTLKFPSGGTISIEIYGKNYTVVERQYRNPVGGKGESLVWFNPLIDNIAVVYDLSEWLEQFYNTRIEYSYKTRGNPELDVGDVIWQSNAYDPLLKVILSEYRLDFKQSFSGRALTNRIGGSS